MFFLNQGHNPFFYFVSHIFQDGNEIIVVYFSKGNKIIPVLKVLRPKSKSVRYKIRKAVPKSIEFNTAFY